MQVPAQQAASQAMRSMSQESEVHPLAVGLREGPRELRELDLLGAPGRQRSAGAEGGEEDYLWTWTSVSSHHRCVSVSGQERRKANIEVVRAAAVVADPATGSKDAMGHRRTAPVVPAQRRDQIIIDHVGLPKFQLKG